MAKRHVTKGEIDTEKINELRRKLKRDWDSVDAQVVTDWLNRPDRLPDEPVGKLIEIYTRMRAPNLFEPDERDLSLEFKRVIDDLNKYGFGLVLIGEQFDPTTEKFPVRWTWKPGAVHPDLAQALIKLVALGERGLADRIRQCSHCQRWFYARRSHMKFCSIGHQVEHNHAEAEFKERRAKAARERRRREKKQRKAKGGK